MLVELRELQKQTIASAVQFLQSKVQGKMEVQRNQVRIEDETPRKVKLLLRKFIHENNLTNYRVVSTNKDRLMIVRIKQPSEGSRDDKVNGVPPFPPLSGERLPLMDTVYPNYLADKIRKNREEKKLRSLANR